MKKIPEDVRKMVYDAYNGCCACKECYNKAMEIHHVKSNSKSNNAKYPIFMQSPFNLVPICRPCHDSSAIYQFKITDRKAQMYEDWLMKFKDDKRIYG